MAKKLSDGAKFYLYCAVAYITTLGICAGIAYSAGKKQAMSDFVDQWCAFAKQMFDCYALPGDGVFDSGYSCSPFAGGSHCNNTDILYMQANFTGSVDDSIAGKAAGAAIGASALFGLCLSPMFVTLCLYLADRLPKFCFDESGRCRPCRSSLAFGSSAKEAALAQSLLHDRR